MVQEFFQQGLIFLESDKNWFSFVFTVLPKHIKIKSPLKYKSVCGRVAKPSGVSTTLSSHNRSIEGSSLNSPIIFSIILNKNTVSQLFIADLLYFIISYHIISYQEKDSSH